MNSFKKHFWFMVVVSVSIVIFLVALIISVILIKNEVKDAAIWIAFISGAIVYIGTVALGLVTYWQSKVAKDTNDKLIKFQESQYKTDNQAVIEFQKNFEVCKQKHKEIMLKNASKGDVNALIVSDCPIDEIYKGLSGEKEYYSFEFEFKTFPGRFKKSYVRKFELNRLCRDDEDKKCLYQNFNILECNKTNLACSFNPKKKNYILSVLLYDSKQIISDANQESLLVFDIEIVTESLSEIKTLHQFCINIGQVALPSNNTFVCSNLEHVDLEKCEIISEEIL